MGKPPPPPEAALIRLARTASKITVASAAQRAAMSKARWTQIEQGFETRKGAHLPAWAPPGTLAHMAHAVGISPERLETEGERPDAAAVLREILRCQQEARQEPADARPPVVRENWDDPMVRELWAIEYPKLRVKEDWIRSYLSDRDAGTAAPVRRRA